MRARWWMAAVMLVGGPASSAQAGRLEAARASVRPPPPANRAPTPTASSRPPHTSSGPVRVHTVSAPPATARGSRTVTYVIVRRAPPVAVPPPVALGPQPEALSLQGPPPHPAPPPIQRFVQRWPYERGTTGWVVDPWDPKAAEHRRVSGRLEAEGAYLYKGLWRTGVAGRVGTARLDVDTQLSFYLDRPHQDALYLGDTSLNFAPVARPRLVWRLGLGARYMLDARLPGAGPREYAAGWNVSTGLDAFPVRPFVISARVDRGTLYQTPVWRARATIGVVRERFELYAGYEHTQIDRVALGGPALGLRLWL